MPDGIVPSRCLENWPTLAYRLLFFRSVRAPDSRRPDNSIMRCDDQKGKGAGGLAGSIFSNLRLARGKRAARRGAGGLAALGFRQGLVL